MVTKLSPELLDRQPEEVSRVLALSLIEEAATALARMENPEDDEALHDFRVGLRRLRSAMRAYRHYLEDSVPKKTRKALRSLAASTSTARDTEVQVAWIHAQGPRLNETEMVGVQWLAEKLKATGEDGREDRLRSLSQGFNLIRKVLTKRLSFWKVRLDVADQAKSQSFRKVTGSIALQQLAPLIAQLDAIHEPDDDLQAHSARIRAKRLRYLLEPLSRAVPETKAVVKQLKRLQDLLGDLHDSNLMVAEIGSAMEASAIEGARRLHELAFRHGEPADPQGPDENPGLLALARLLKERRQALFTQIKTEWQGARLEKFRARMEELGDQMSSFGEDRRAIRRYVLHRAPEELRHHPNRLIQEGWLPGAGIEEFLRKVRTREGTRYFRIIPENTEAGETTREESLSRRVFESFWPLTEKRRTRKRRYEISDGSRKWRVDVFSGIGLVLAETNLLPNERPEGELHLPDWLAGCTKREVTGDKLYSRPYSIPQKSVGRSKKSPARARARRIATATQKAQEPGRTKPTQQENPAGVLEERLPSNGRDRNLSPQSSPQARPDKP